MQRGVGVAGSGVAKLQSEILSFGGRVRVGLFINTLKNAEPRRQVSLGHVPNV
jgi:hypothetical protein